jgi:serine/threonine protein kinase
MAMMEHPNIAQVFDAGTTHSGRPFFVMELVRGIPITDYCDKANCSVEKRLELFAQVCHAVQHAHQKGVIHRDIKPGNILVTMHAATPVIKVIDFGVAKALNQRLTERTLFTRFGAMIGTPNYMSPEQAEFSGLDVDNRTDVYALGVLLYELLTGQTLFDMRQLREAAFDEIRRIIREVEPTRPSTKLSTLPTAEYRERFGYLAFSRSCGTTVGALLRDGTQLIESDDTHSIYDTRARKRFQLPPEVLRVGRAFISGVVHTLGANHTLWLWLIDKGVRFDWPEESGGSETVAQLVRRCQLLREEPARMECLKWEDLSAPKDNNLPFVDFPLYQILDAERKRQRAGMVAAMTQVVELLNMNTAKRSGP